MKRIALGNFPLFGALAVALACSPSLERYAPPPSVQRMIPAVRRRSVGPRPKARPTTEADFARVEAAEAKRRRRAERRRREVAAGGWVYAR